MGFSHFKDGKAVMVDVSKKEDTSRGNSLRKYRGQF
jgi:molybdenum cofactor biosynthesis enzyme